MNAAEAIPPDLLDAKVAIVTGASRGIGAATARTLARAGAAVVLAARDEDALASVAEHISAAGGRALVVPTDVGDAATVERLVARTVDAYGRLDIAFNNAAAAATCRRHWRRWRWRTTTAPSRSAFAASSCR